MACIFAQKKQKEMKRRRGIQIFEDEGSRSTCGLAKKPVYCTGEDERANCPFWWRN